MDNNVGTITLGTKVNTKGVDKGLVDIERKVTGKGFMDKFSRMFNGLFSKVSSGASKITNSMSKGMTSITKSLGSIFSSVSGIKMLIGSISLVGIIGMVGLIIAKSEQIKAIVEKIVNWINKAIGIFSIFLQDILGIDMASKSVSNNFKETTKSVKALRKQLLGFDEMNILNKDTGTTGALSGLGGTSEKTSQDYGIYNDMSDLNKDLYNLGVVAVYTGDDLKETRLQLEQLIADVKNGKATMTKSNGMITITNKAGRAIKLTTKEYEKLLDDINHSRVTSRNLDIWWKIRGAFQDWNVNEFRENLNNAIIFAKNGLEGAVVNYEGNMVKVRLATGQTFTFTKEQWEKINEQARLNANNTKNNWVTSLNEIVAKATGNDPNSLKGGLIGVFDLINQKSAKDAEETKKKWVNTADEMTKKFIGAFQNIPDNTKLSLDETIKFAEKTINAFTPPKKKITFEADVSKVKERLISLLTNFSNAGGLFGTINTNLISKIRNASKGAIINPPRLAKGGIINRPGRGVPIAVGGERGAEAVVPLTDNQQMAYLGREIAKNIVINLTSVTELDGRQIARATSQVMNDMNFASNGGVI